MGAIDHSVSLIAILNSLTLNAPVEAVPEDAQIPLRWYVLTKWQIEESDKDKNYEQKLALLNPDGKEVFANVMQLTPNGHLHMTVNAFVTMPFLYPGVHQVVAEFREKGTESWNRVGFYLFLVSHTQHPDTATPA